MRGNVQFNYLDPFGHARISLRLPTIASYQTFKNITTFSRKRRTYSFEVMPFGLINALSKFQTMISFGTGKIVTSSNISV